MSDLDGGPGDEGQQLRAHVHALRQSLGTILMLTGTARMHDALPDEVKEVLALIESEVSVASTICRRLIEQDR